MNQRTKSRRIRRRSGVGTGTTSLLMIFTVLCFATLAMLSLSTAVSNDRIQARGLAGAKALAEARGAAAVEVAALDETLLLLQEEMAVGSSGLSSVEPAAAGSGQAAYLEQALAAAEERGWEVDRAAGVITLRQAVNEESVLVTRLQILEPGVGARYEVLSQMTELVNGWAPEQDGQLWKPAAAV